jgi:hypothetical protein
VRRLRFRMVVDILRREEPERKRRGAGGRALGWGALGLRVRVLYGTERPYRAPEELPMTLTTRIAWDDTVLPFQLDRSDIRGRVARLDTTLEQILQQHDYPPEVEALVAEMALLTAMIGQTIKLRWKLSLQVRGDGPIRLIATDFYAPRGWRARAHPRLRQLRCRKTGFGRRSVRADRQGLFRDPDRPGQGHRPLPGDHAPVGRLADRLRRDLFRPVRAVADPLHCRLRPEPGARGTDELARRWRDVAAHAEAELHARARAARARKGCCRPRT